MKVKYYIIVWLIILAHLTTEFHSVVLFVYPKSKGILASDWFIKPGFEINGLTMLWFLRGIQDAAFLAIIMFCAALQAHSRTYKSYLQWQRFSYRLYMVWCIWFLHSVFDMGMFLYNYKNSIIAYAIALPIFITATLFVAFFKLKKYLKDSDNSYI
jgi:hypothetical protein